MGHQKGAAGSVPLAHPAVAAHPLVGPLVDPLDGRISYSGPACMGPVCLGLEARHKRSEIAPTVRGYIPGVDLTEGGWPTFAQLGIWLPHLS